MTNNRRIVVSIDFGTTYSGVAWADTTRPDVQHVVTEWPSAGSSKSSPKVPTELRKVAAGWQWGFQIPESAKRSKYFKLFVSLHSSSTTSFDQNLL
jgi:molecular chaperone DnaK (HSP70)